MFWGLLATKIVSATRSYSISNNLKINPQAVSPNCFYIQALYTTWKEIWYDYVSIQFSKKWLESVTISAAIGPTSRPSHKIQWRNFSVSYESDWNVPWKHTSRLRTAILGYVTQNGTIWAGGKLESWGLVRTIKLESFLARLRSCGTHVEIYVQ